jgi:hypothetical protein
MSNTEVRLATVTLAALAASIPLFYLVRNFTSSPSQESSPHVRTFRKFLTAYSTLRPQALIANATNDFTITTLPTSLQIPSRALEPFRAHAAMIFSLFKDFAMIPQPNPSAIHFSPETNTVVAHCKMGGKVNEDSPQGKKLVEQGLDEWWTECVLFVRMDDTGLRVVEVREFVHSAKADELKGRLTGVLEGKHD